jgi:drug/metabolite transporter (DMT)-like permease
VLGIVLVLLAIISLNVKNLSLEKNHFYGLVAGALFGIAYTLDKKIVQSVDPIIYIFWVFTLVAFFGFLFNPKAVIDMVKNARFEYYRPILISGIGYFLYNFFTFSAYKVGGEVGRVDAINNSQVFLIILVEYFIIRHKDNISRKLISAGIAFTGVMILGFL